MKSLTMTLLLLVAVAILTPGGAVGQESWSKDAHNPVLSGTGSGYEHALSPCVIYNPDSSRYEMWFTRVASSVALTRPWLVGFATSPDGSSWTQHPSPVLSPTPGTWDANTVDNPMVIRENKTYKMWYTSYLDATSPSYIGYATSVDGINWTKYAGNPVFGPGTSAWDKGGFNSCSVLSPTGRTTVYQMWYEAYNATWDTLRFGYATSLDGIVWDRDTVHNPIFLPGGPGQWDQGISGPRVLKIPGMEGPYCLWYAGSGSAQAYATGLAISSNGITGWTRSSLNPVLSQTPGAWDGTYVGIGSVLLRDSLFHAWYEGGLTPTSSNHFRIGHATSLVTDISDASQKLPATFALEQNYPNPFNPTTVIRYSVPVASEVRVVVHDLLGREAAVLLSERKGPGSYSVQFDAAGLSSGVYICRLTAGSFEQSRSMLLLK